jgi:hypothetical protein
MQPHPKNEDLKVYNGCFLTKGNTEIWSNTGFAPKKFENQGKCDLS